MGADKRVGVTKSRSAVASRKLLEKRARRQDRQARSKKGRDWTRIVYGSILAAMGLAAVVGLIYANNAPALKRIQPAQGRAQQVGDRMPVEPGIHIPPPQRGNYATDPPTSGQHYSIPGQAPTAWGFYDQALEPEVWLHNLEHGGIVILYNCPPPTSSTGATLVEGGASSCPDDQGKISDFISSAPQDTLFHEVKIVATEYPVPNHRFAILAWGWRQFMDTWDDTTAERFYEAHVDNGPERIP